MAGNRRGKLKENFEGIHRNFDWIQYHCAKSLDLIGDTHPNLSESIISFAKGVTTLDELAQSIYSHL